MKREIKFRAWDGKEMHQDVSPWRWDFVISNSWHRCEKNTGTGMSGIGGNSAEMLVPAIRFKDIMQFTGFKDKNGEEIYDGDIIGDWVEVDGEMKQSRLTVHFDEVLGQWHVDTSMIQNRTSCAPLFSELQDFAYEIISNIHENPELLREKETNNN